MQNQFFLKKKMLMFIIIGVVLVMAGALAAGDALPSMRLLAKAKEESDAIIRDFLDTLIIVNTYLTVARVNQATCANRAACVKRANRAMCVWGLAHRLSLLI